MGGNESETCQCAKHDRKAENVLSRPTNERVAAAAAGRFVEAPSDTPPIAGGSKQPNEARAPPLLGYSINEFCKAVGISVSYFYELKQANLTPRIMKLGTRRIISVEEAQAWCRERTAAAAKSS